MVLKKKTLFIRIEQYQKSHMANHFALYSPLFVKFLSLARNFNFKQSEDVDALSRVIDVWADLHGSQLRELEDEWDRITANAPNRSRSHQNTPLSCP